MEFVQIKVEDKYYPKRLNRLIAVREDLNLNEIGIVICKSIEASFCHLFMFESGNKEFVHPSWLEDDLGIQGIEEYDLNKSTLKDLGKKFVFTYDAGENYEFNCTVFERKIDIDVSGDDYDLVGRTLKGKGLGIFEDNHGCLDDYFDGKIKPNAKKGKDEFDVLPWNLEMEKFGDYEKDLRLDYYDVYEGELKAVSKDIDSNFSINDYPMDIDDGEIDSSVLETFLRETAALDIFEDVDINQIYRKLILTHDINEAYEMIVKCLIDAHKQGDQENLSEEEIDNLYYEAVQDLM